MENIKLEWKKFSIDLISLEQYLKDTYPNYIGNSADYSLTLHFSELSDKEEQAIITYYDTLDETEAAILRSLPSRKNAEDMKIFIKSSKEQIAAKDIVDLTTSEKKIFMGLTLTNDEIDALEK